jgi:hypothetical protein
VPAFGNFGTTSSADLCTWPVTVDAKSADSARANYANGLRICLRHSFPTEPALQLLSSMDARRALYAQSAFPDRVTLPSTYPYDLTSASAGSAIATYAYVDDCPAASCATCHTRCNYVRGPPLAEFADSVAPKSAGVRPGTALPDSRIAGNGPGAALTGHLDNIPPNNPITLGLSDHPLHVGSERATGLPRRFTDHVAAKTPNVEMFPFKNLTGAGYMRDD